MLTVVDVISMWITVTVLIHIIKIPFVKTNCHPTLPWVTKSKLSFPTNVYSFKANIRNTRKRCMFKINNKDTRWHRSGVFIVMREHICHLFVMLLLLTLSKWTIDCWVTVIFIFIAGRAHEKSKCRGRNWWESER